MTKKKLLVEKKHLSGYAILKREANLRQADIADLEKDLEFTTDALETLNAEYDNLADVADCRMLENDRLVSRNTDLVLSCIVLAAALVLGVVLVVLL